MGLVIIRKLGPDGEPVAGPPVYDSRLEELSQDDAEYIEELWGVWKACPGQRERDILEQIIQVAVQTSRDPERFEEKLDQLLAELEASFIAEYGQPDPEPETEQ